MNFIFILLEIVFVAKVLLFIGNAEIYIGMGMFIFVFFVKS
jgi:hypothetical protein